MLSTPKIGQQVRIHYNVRTAGFMPLHGKVGTVTISSRGKPRNHEIVIHGARYCVPCGNLLPSG
jgi:hypothetical protein